MKSNRQNKMIKKILVCCFLTLSLFGINNTIIAQQRTKLSEGVTLVNYGNFQIIEDENRQQSIRIEVKETEKKETSTGETIYAVFCQNKLVKNVTKGGITAAISAGLKATVWGSVVPSWLVGAAVNAAYDYACEYLEKKNNK